MEHSDTRQTRPRSQEEPHVTDPSRYPDAGGTPRWVKAFGTIALVVALQLGYAQTLSDIVGVAADPTVADGDFVLLGTLQRASGGLLLLVVATVLAVDKPRGMTRYGQRKQHGQRRTRTSGGHGWARHRARLAR
jgi:hypothetical protein